MIRTLALTAATTLTSVLLVGCGGGSDTDAYCDQLKDAKSNIEALDSGDIANFDAAIASIKEFADDSPEEVRDDWKVLADTMGALETALADAGLELSDLPGLASGDVPEGADMEKLAGLQDTLGSLGSEEASKAADDIEKHAKSECDIDLGDDS